MRTKRQQVGDIIEMHHIKAIIKTYNGNADSLARYVEQCEDRLREYGYREGRDFSRTEYHRLGRELDAAQSALAIVEEGDDE